MNKALLALSLLTLTSCAHYQAQPLTTLQESRFSDTEKPVALFCKIFTKSDCKRYLDRDVLAEGYQPIQISLQNNSRQEFIFNTDAISLPCVMPDEVADKVHTSTVGRAVAYGVGGIFLWPLLIPAVVDGFGSYHANQQLDSDFDTKAVTSQLLFPYARLNGIIFVPRKSFTPDFTITLYDRETREKLILDSMN